MCIRDSDEDDAELLQRGVAADEGQPVYEFGDDPQGKSGQRGAQQKRAHAGYLATGWVAEQTQKPATLRACGGFCAVSYTHL